MFRVMTLNLNYYGSKYGEWEHRKVLIRDAIRAASPEVIAFQAVRLEPNRFRGMNQAAQLSVEMPEYRYAIFQPAVIYEDSSAEGSAILSRIPILSTGYKALTFLPGQDDPNRRVLLHALFDVNGKPVQVVNAHFSWVDEQVRKNADEAIEYLKRLEEAAVMVGDFNQGPDSKIIQQVASAGWQDGWAALHPEEQGYTFEARSPSMRIDYVWANPQLAQSLTGIQIIPGLAGTDDERMSDHFGLLAEFGKF